MRAAGAPSGLRAGDPVILRLARIRRRACSPTKEPFNNLFSHLDVELLMWSF